MPVTHQSWAKPVIGPPPPVPNELQAVEDLLKSVYPNLWANLTAPGRRSLTQEVAAGFSESPEAASDAIEVWTRTLEFRLQPDYQAAMEAALELPELAEPVYTPEELRAKLNLPR